MVTDALRELEVENEALRDIPDPTLCKDHARYVRSLLQDKLLDLMDLATDLEEGIEHGDDDCQPHLDAVEQEAETVRTILRALSATQGGHNAQ
jgi:hypothetical protein